MNPRLNLAPERRLVMTLALCQALEVLQMNQLELGQWLQSEIEKNPLLELDTPRLKGPEIDAAASLTLHEHLQNQIRENFPTSAEQRIAEQYLEHLDERGFFCSPQENGPILSILQTFDPPGIFARTLQESLFLQLQAKGQGDSLAARIVQTSFEDLLHGRYGAIKKRLRCPDLGSAIHDLARLSLRPASAFRQDPASPIYPDLCIDKIEGGWTVELIEDALPKFHIREDYLAIELESPEEKESLQSFKTQAKWICRSLERRSALLRAIGRLLICKQAPYLDHKGHLAPLTIRELAEKLEIHESTLSRALSGKYASTPRGLLPLHSLLSSTPAADTARHILKQLIKGEDKESPLTDDQLAQALAAKGFSVARRTVAKYRNQLKIGPAAQRKF